MATADSDYLDRTVDDIFTSYQYVMKQRDPFAARALELCRVSARSSELKSEPCRKVLVNSRFDRRGWYSYQEPVLRGYVRMQAEAHGIELIGETPAARSQARVGPDGGTTAQVPRGVHIGRRR